MWTGLSIRQPWVELILRGHKTIEVRSWPTSHRGELWLHAGARPDREALSRFEISAEPRELGALVGVCELRDCVEFTAATWEAWRGRHLNDGPLDGRRFAWILVEPRRIEPAPMKGRLRLWRMAPVPGVQHVQP